MFPEFTEPRKPDGCGTATGHATPIVTREPMERFPMSHPIDRIDNSRSTPLQMEHDEQTCSGRSQNDTPAENRQTQPSPVPSTSLIASPRAPVPPLPLPPAATTTAP